MSVDKSLFQLTFRVTGSRKIFRGSENTDLPKFSCWTTQFVGSGSQLSQVFDPRPAAYLEHCKYPSIFSCQMENIVYLLLLLLLLLHVPALWITRTRMIKRKHNPLAFHSRIMYLFYDNAVNLPWFSCREDLHFVPPPPHHLIDRWCLLLKTVCLSPYLLIPLNRIMESQN